MSKKEKNKPGLHLIFDGDDRRIVENGECKGVVRRLGKLFLVFRPDGEDSRTEDEEAAFTLLGYKLFRGLEPRSDTVVKLPKSMCHAANDRSAAPSYSPFGGKSR